MTVGFSTVNLANALLNTISGTSFVTPATFVALHTDDPGADGSANFSLVTVRKSATFGAAAAGAMALASPLAWLMTGTETISHISVWSAATGGTFYWSAELSTPLTVANGDTLTLNTCGLALAPLAG